MTVAASAANGPESDGPGAEPSNEPITLTADHAIMWDEGPVRWISLEGRASVMQDRADLHASAILVRIKPSEGQDAGLSSQLEAYAEGLTRVAGEDHARNLARRLTLRGRVRVLPRETGGISKREGPPPDQVALRERAFPAEQAASSRRIDSSVARAQNPGAAPLPLAPPELPPVEPAVRPELDSPPVPDAPAAPEPEVEPLPMPDEDPPPSGPALNNDDLVPPSELPATSPPGGAAAPQPVPKLPESYRFFSYNPRDSSTKFFNEAPMPDGRLRVVIRGGVNFTIEQPLKGMIDISADNAVVWIERSANQGGGSMAAGTRIAQDTNSHLEIYLQGHVVFRQDERKLAGSADQKIVLAEQFYIDVRTEWFLAQRGEISVFNPMLIAPLKIKGERLQQYRPLLPGKDGRVVPGPAQIHIDQALLTGSRFPSPGYRYEAGSVELTELPDRPNQADGPMKSPWQVDSRSNYFKIGELPVFYWPRIVTETDDLDPPLRQLQFRANNYFGQQFLTTWNTFKLIGLKRPDNIDIWNFDLDYLSYRGLAAGTELGWRGNDLVGDLTDPYHKLKSSAAERTDRQYFGYFDVWGLRDLHVDNLGPGPAIVTNGPPGAGKHGFQRDADPAFQDNRGRVTARHMQYFTDPDAPNNEEMRLQLEANYYSDRNFQEQYYKRLFDTGLDESTLAYFIYQRDNHALSLLTSANLQTWYTDTQWFPKLDYYRLGDSPFGIFTYFQNSGVGYANTHTDQMVNNPNLFAFQPFDPVSATSGAFQTGRAWTSHELDLPLNLSFVHFTPYLQGQLTGWDNQYATELPPLTLAPNLPNTAYIRGPQGAWLGRYWGAAGARLNVMAWKLYPGVESELLNVHGLAHKISFDIDFRDSYSNVDLNRIGVLDQLDDNSYEFTRRYFALTNYVGGVLPAQYDPRFLALRSLVSPITGTTDIQGTMETAQFALRQRLQTKRGPEGKRRVVDWMTLDLSSTYFPDAQRDNFGKPWGLTRYNYEWFLGDRTSITSTGWFEFWNVTGNPILISNPNHTNSPFGLDVITTGISFARPPRSNIYLGYSIVNTGVMNTSAVNTAFSYWLSPKWYGSFSTSYDFGNRRWLGSTWGVTRIGADFLASVGLTVDPLRNSYTFGLELTPRLSPNVRFGSGGGFARFDPRFAPTQ